MMSVPDPYLVFVYNADSGFFEALKDGVTKFASPSTYPCRLCALTYGLATMRPRCARAVNRRRGTPLHTSTEGESWSPS